MALAFKLATIMPDPANDDIRPSGALDKDAPGEAALLLVESLIHELIERAGLTLEEAINIVKVAEDVQIEHGVSRGNHPADIARSIRHLSAIKTSLEIDLR